MFNHPFRHVMDSWDAGRGRFGQVVPPGPPPGWTPAGISEGRPVSGDGSNATKVVDALVGKPVPLTLKDAFEVLFSKLQEFPGNEVLIGQAEGFRQAVTERLEQQRAARRGALEKEREELRGECRQRLDRVRTLRVEFNSWDGQINAFAEQSSRARAAFAAIQAAEPAPENYPTKLEMADWAERLHAAEAIVVEAEGRERWAETERRNVMQTLQQAIEQFQEAEQKETLLAARLDGRPYPGPYGITHPPEDL